jgi:hypothetical protein
LASATTSGEPGVSGVRPSTAPTRLRVTAGGLLLWGGTIAIGGSTVVVLAALSHHLHHSGFTNVSTLFGLFFVASLIPSGVPLRAAALEVDGAPPMHLTTRQYLLMAAAGAAVSPLIALALHLPVLAIVLVSAQVILAIPLSIKRGSLIAVHRFDAMGGNLFVEAGARTALGTIGGLLWGMNGVAAGLAAATAVALVCVPRQRTVVTRVQRRMTSMLHTWLALVLLGLFVQLDVLVAPRALTRSAATHYDLAALPSKGVYLVLLAASTLIFPYVRVHARRKVVLLVAAATLVLGLLITTGLGVSRGIIGAVLGQNAASLSLLVALGAAMSVAGAIGIVINGGIALGVARPWPPLLLGIACLMVCSLFGLTAAAFGVVVLSVQAGTLVLTGFVCLRRRPLPPVPSASTT